MGSEVLSHGERKRSLQGVTLRAITGSKGASQGAFGVSSLVGGDIMALAACFLQSWLPNRHGTSGNRKPARGRQQRCLVPSQLRH